MTRHYTVLYKPEFERQFRKLERVIQVRVGAAIDALTTNAHPSGSKKLHGAEDLYRVRVGDYRVVYQIRENVVTIVLIRVAHRRDVYRKDF
ncbi:MAG: type II toxin-antitoxin system RelE/ParE family toxin [Planctomycetota bacterium]